MAEEIEGLEQGWDTGLTGKQKSFVIAYCTKTNSNVTEAARLAGYKSPHPEGSRLLRNATIRAAIDAFFAEKALGALEVLYRLTEEATADVLDVADPVDKYGEVIKPEEYDSYQGKVRLALNPLKALKNGKSHLIKSVKPTRWGDSFEMHDGRAALIALGRKHKLFVDRQEVTGKDGSDLFAGIAASVDSKLDNLLARASEAGVLGQPDGEGEGGT